MPVTSISFDLQPTVSRQIVTRVGSVYLCCAPSVADNMQVESVFSIDQAKIPGILRLDKTSRSSERPEIFSSLVTTQPEFIIDYRGWRALTKITSDSAQHESDFRGIHAIACSTCHAIVIIPPPPLRKVITCEAERWSRTKSKKMCNSDYSRFRF